MRQCDEPPASHARKSNVDKLSYWLIRIPKVIPGYSQAAKQEKDHTEMCNS